MKSAIFNKKTIYTLIGVLLVIAGIEIVANVKDNSLIFPHISDIWVSLLKIVRGENISSLLMLLGRVLACVGISLVVSLLVVVLYKIDKDSVNILRPVLAICKSTPVIIVTLLIWLLTDTRIGLYLVCIISILPVMVDGMLSSMENIPRRYIDIYKMERTNIFSELVQVELPLIAPNILLVVMQTLGMAIKISVVAEYVYQLAGSLGKSLKFAYDYTNMADLLAIGLMLALLEIVIEIVIVQLKKKLESNTKE